MSIIDKPIVKTLMLKGEKGDPGDLDSTAIVDNLTTNRADKVLSARQGKILKDLVDGNTTGISTNTTNISNETSARQSADTTLQNNINSEATARANADSSLQSQITGLASGSPKAVNSKSEMTDTTKNYVLTTDGHWYYYNGTTWVDGGVYQSAGIANESITPFKTNFFDSSSNLLIPELCQTGKQINNSGVITDNTNYFITGLIEITPNKNYAMFNSSGSYFGNTNLALYDENQAFLEKVSTIYSDNIKTTNTSAKYMRVEGRVVGIPATYDFTQWCLQQIDTPSLSGRNYEYYAKLKDKLFYKKNITSCLLNTFNSVGQGGCVIGDLYVAINRFAHTFTVINMKTLKTYSIYFDNTLTLNHANDITYNPNTDKIICADMTTNELLEFNSDFTYSRSISISYSVDVIISGIAYDNKNNRYIGYTENNEFIFLDSSFNVTNLVPFTRAGTKQGMTVFEDKILLSYNTGNFSYIAYYNLDGTIIEEQQLPIPDDATKFEIEGLGFYNGLLVYNGLYNNKSYFYIVDNKADSLFNNIVYLVRFLNS